MVLVFVSSSSCFYEVCYRRKCSHCPGRFILTGLSMNVISWTCRGHQCDFLSINRHSTDGKYLIHYCRNYTHCVISELSSPRSWGRRSTFQENILAPYPSHLRFTNPLKFLKVKRRLRRYDFPLRIQNIS